LWNFACISWHLRQFQWRTSCNPPVSLCVYVRVSLPSLLGDGSVYEYMFPWKRIHDTKNCWTRRFLSGPCRGPWLHTYSLPKVSPSLTHTSIRGTSGHYLALPRNLQNRRKNVYCLTLNVVSLTTFTSSFPSMCTVSLQGKHFPAATKNCWRNCFLCGKCRIRGK
jgi:hypothetical protein